MAEKPTIRIFISSPADVRPERLLAERIVARLDREFSFDFHTEAILWEREPLVAAHHFQDPRNIPPPSSTDIVVVILWSRLGVPLPESEFRGAISGRQVTGTEWEFEDALAAARKNGGVPAILAYRKRQAVVASLDDEALLDELRSQKSRLEDFIARWFGDAASGDIRAALHSYGTIPEFEDALYEHLSALLARRAGSLPARSEVRWRDAPFRGLQSFDLEHAAIFFGRTRARNELREQLARLIAGGARPWLIVSGASGSGKSSLVKAGLLPDLMLPGMLGRVALCRYAVMRPSEAERDLLSLLAARILGETALPELRGLRYDEERLAGLLRDAPAQAALPIEQGLAEAAKSAELVEGAQARLVLVLDQFEELFSGAMDEQARSAFVRALDALARTNLVWIVATLRGDFVDRLDEVPELAGSVNTSAHYFLSTPNETEFGQIIRQPARDAGLRFETNPLDGSSLDETIRQSATKDPNVLPLLSFLLDELWRNRGPNGELTFAAYERLGGLEGALAKRAEDAFATLPAETQAALPRVLRALVSAEAGAQLTARTAPLDQFPKGGRERALIDALSSSDARLLVTGGTQGQSTVRVTHEALLSRWQRAADYLAEDRADLEMISRLRRDAARWASAPKAASESLLLPAGLPLAEARGLVARRGDELDAEIVRFVRASALAQTARLRRRRLLVAASFLTLTILTAFALLQWRNAEIERRDQLVAESHFLALDAQKDVAQGDAVLGILVALAALPKEIDNPNRPYVAEAEYALEDAFVNKRELRVFRGHQDFVTFASFSPDGRRIVSSSSDSSVRVWNAGDGAQIALLAGHRGDYVWSAAFSPDGRRIVSASSDRTVRIWDAASGAQLRVLRGHRDSVMFAAFSPDGRRIVSSSADHTVRVWDAAGGAALAVLRGHSDKVSCAVFSPDGKQIASSSLDGTLRLWDAASGATLAVLRGHKNQVWSVDFSPDGKRLVSASNDRTAIVWDAASGRQIATLSGHEADVWSAEFAPDGSRIVTASADGTARIWDAVGFTQIGVLRGHEDTVTYAAFSPDSRRVASASYDKTVRLWDATAGNQLVLRGDPVEEHSVAFSPDGARLVSASGNGGVRLWDATAGTQLRVLRAGNGAVSSAAFSPDGKRIASAGADATVRLWDAASGAPLAVLRGHRGPVASAQFSADGKRIVSASDDATVRIWDARSGTQLAVLRGHQAEVHWAAFSPDGSRIASTSADKTIRIWDAANGTQLAVLRGHQNDVWSVAFSPDGTRVASASGDESVRVWDVRSGAQLAVLRGHQDWVFSVAFSPDGKRLVSSSGDKTVRVWDAGSGVPIAVLHGNEDVVSSTAFSPSGTRIASASDDRTIRIWDMALRDQALIDAARQFVPRQLSEAQRSQELLTGSNP